MPVYEIQEYPNIDDPDLVRSCVQVQKMRLTLNAFFKHVLSQLASIPFTRPTRVAFIIIHRLAEGSISIELLCQKNRVRDAAILVLNLHELILDLQYIALDKSRADTWLDHTKEQTKPWRVGNQIKEIYNIKNEQESERDIYRWYSMTKHGNPAGKHFVFPISQHDRDSLLLDCSNNNNPMVRCHMFALGTHIYRAGTAAARIYASEGLDVDDFADRLNAQWETLSSYNEEHIRSVLEEWTNATIPPTA